MMRLNYNFCKVTLSNVTVKGNRTVPYISSHKELLYVTAWLQLLMRPQHMWGSRYSLLITYSNQVHSRRDSRARQRNERRVAVQTWDSESRRNETVTHCSTHCNILQHTTTHCNILQHTATHCDTLQHTAAPRHLADDESIESSRRSNSKKQRAGIPACVA